MGMLEGWRMLWGGEEHSLVVTNQLWNQAALSSSRASANYQLRDLSEPQFPHLENGMESTSLVGLESTLIFARSVPPALGALPSASS